VRNVVNLFHGGDLGDTVYAVPAARRLADPAHLTLYPNHGVTRSLMDEANAAMLLPLLNAQRGLTADWRPAFAPDGLRLDFAVRRFYKHGLNLADMHSHWVGHDHWPRERPWLVADRADTRYRIVVGRSARYRNPNFPWRRLYDQFAGRACFVGVPWEHENFEAEVGRIDFAETPTLLEVARLLAGCDLFVGNQSCPLALANALCVPAVVEQAHPVNCHFERAGAWYPWGHADRLPALADPALADHWCHAAARRADGRSCHNPSHLEALARACRAARDVGGLAAEAGVYEGGSAAVLAWCLTRPVHLSDTFDATPADADHRAELESVRRSLRVHPVEFHPGPFPAGLPDGPYAFAHVDFGVPGPAADAVAWFRPRLAAGGVLAVGGWRDHDLRRAVADAGFMPDEVDGNLAWQAKGRP
jgi:hypothetical protein